MRRRAAVVAAGALALSAILALGLVWRNAAAERDALQERIEALEAEGAELRASAEQAADTESRLRAALRDAESGEAELERRLAAYEARTAELEEAAAPELLRRSVEENAHVSAGRYRSETADFPYLLYEPGGLDAGEAHPMIVYLHGTGGRGTDPERIYSENSLPNFLRDGLLRPNALVLIPQCPEESNWYQRRFELMELIEAVAAETGADRARISVTGFSMGGIGCFALLTQFPEFFSAAAPFAATFSPAACSVITATPVRMFHGSADEGMGFDVVRINQVIRQAGGSSELVLFSGEGHTIQGHYLDDGGRILDWLAAQTRT